MHKIDLRRFDLNLLVVFDTLMRERHVGRAGEVLGLTQPAVSHALGRLRHLLDDPLFVKHARGMRPTPHAEALATPLASALQALHATLNPKQNFDPKQARRTITIGGSDYVDLTLMPPLMQAIRSEAPGFDIRLRAITRATVLPDLRRKEIDLAIGPIDAAPAALDMTPLFSERLVMIGRRRHPAMKGALSAKSFAALSHLLVSPRGDPIGSVDEVLREAGLARRVVLTVPHFLAAPFVIGATDLVAVMAERIAQRLATASRIAIRPLPVTVQPWTIGLARPSNAPSDPALDWLIALIVRISQTI
jgi:DNA-binding transcriptional LysR family regulator